MYRVKPFVVIASQGANNSLSSFLVSLNFSIGKPKVMNTVIPILTASPTLQLSLFDPTKSTHSIRRIHLLGFIEEIRHSSANMPDRRFCFVLGAGASEASPIPTAGELALD